VLDQLLQIAVRCLIAITLILGLVNAGYMLISPAAWRSLPEWLRIRKLGVKKYGQGWSAMQVRITGALILATVLWMGYIAIA
jgi:hypothetical protein